MNSKRTQQTIRLRNRSGHNQTWYVTRTDCGKWFRIVLDSETRQIRPGEPLHVAVRRAVAGITRRTWPDDPQYWIDENPVKCNAVVRIWTYWRDGIVRVSVPWDSEISFGDGGATDEGWSRHIETFNHDADTDTVTRTSHNEGSDCDGRYSNTTEEHWKRGGELSPMFEFDRAGNQLRIPGIMQPAWNVETQCQYDANAELAGY